MAGKNLKEEKLGEKKEITCLLPSILPAKESIKPVIETPPKVVS